MKKETLPQKQNRAKNIFTRLKRIYPQAGMILRFSNPWELLVAVILSAQCTDKKVNEVTEKLFKKYRMLDDYIRASASERAEKEFEDMIHSTGFYRAKAKHILTTARIVKENFGGKVPKTMEEMLTLRGVARKTANVVLGNAYDVVEGIAVDTHVSRLSQRLDLSAAHDPKKIERDLMELLPKKNWFRSTYLLIEHGRKICTAKDPRCDLCPLQKLCPSAFQFPRFQKNNDPHRRNDKRPKSH
ncbi:MAG: endonuclease III [Candidatus Sungbacteria bacterium]|nr:endonuclease III [Candidatus Sungbacteria bacterium]